MNFCIFRDTTIKLNIDMTPEDKVKEFEPNIINSTVYLICMGLQVSTFAVNYKGHPFMESLRENRLLMYSILASSGVVLCLALNLIPDLQSAFQIIDFPNDVSRILKSGSSFLSVMTSMLPSYLSKNCKIVSDFAFFSPILVSPDSHIRAASRHLPRIRR